MSTQVELERTFLARHIPAQIGGARSEVIVDTYIPTPFLRGIFRPLGCS